MREEPAPEPESLDLQHVLAPVHEAEQRLQIPRMAKRLRLGGNGGLQDRQIVMVAQHVGKPPRGPAMRHDRGRPERLQQPGMGRNRSESMPLDQRIRLRSPPISSTG